MKGYSQPRNLTMLKGICDLRENQGEHQPEISTVIPY